MPKNHTYLVVEATRSRWGSVNAETGLKGVETIRVVGSRANRPAKLERDQIAVKVTLDIPDSAFNPVVPTAVVTVPDNLALRGPIGVEAEDANDE